MASVMDNNLNTFIKSEVVEGEDSKIKPLKDG